MGKGVVFFRTEMPSFVKMDFSINRYTTGSQKKFEKHI